MLSKGDKVAVLSADTDTDNVGTVLELQA